MKQVMRVTVGAVLCFALTGYCVPANSQQPSAPELIRPPICDQFNVDGRASAPLRTVSLPPQQICTIHTNNGFPVPDPNCTPGAINPTLTIEVLRDRSFTTRCIRDAATQEVEKATTYEWYNLPHPSNNSGEAQICELDHLISLELGGADTRPRSKTCASGSRHLLVPLGPDRKAPLSGNAAGDAGHGFGQLWEKWRVQSRLASLQPQTFCGWPMAILATAMPAARPLPCLHRKPFATGILCAAAWQFNYNYLFGDRILTEVEPLPSPSLRDGEWPPLTSNFTDLTIN